MKKGLNTFLSAVLAFGTTGLAFAAPVDQASSPVKASTDARLNSGFQAKSATNLT